MKKSLLLLLAASVGVVGSVAANNGAVSQKVAYAKFAGKNKLEAKVVDTRSVKPAVMQKGDITGKNVVVSSLPTEEGGMNVVYANPTLFNVGESENGYAAIDQSGTPLSRYLIPAYSDVTWENFSTGASSYSWSYISPDLSSELTSVDEDLTVSYEWTQGYSLLSPTLTASNGTATAEYASSEYFVAGGQLVDDEGGMFGVGVFDGVNALSFTTCDFAALGTDMRENLFGEYAAYVDKADIVGFGNLYPKPAAPYAISKVWGYFGGVWDAGAVFDCTVYSIKNGEYSVLANGEYTAQSAYASPEGGMYMSDLASLSFNLQQEVEGWTSEGFVTVSDSIYVQISSSDPKVTSLYPVAMIPTEDSGRWISPDCLSDEGYLVIPEYQQTMFNAYISVDVESEVIGNGTLIDYYPSFYSFSGELQSLGYWNPMGFYIYTDMMFNWLNNPNSDSNTVTVPAAGGSSEAYYLFTYPEENESILVDNDLDEDGVIDDAEWLSYDMNLPYVDESGESFYYGDITFTADALPSGETSRTATVVLTTVGADPLELTVIQGATGISAVEAASAAKVAVVGGDFVVTAPEAINAVTVYNVAGQAVAASEVAGTTTVSGQSLTKGVYILRFNDGSSVKVVK